MGRSSGGFRNTQAGRLTGSAGVEVHTTRASIPARAPWTAPNLAAAIKGFLKGSFRSQSIDTGTAVELLADAANVLRRPGASFLAPWERDAILAGLRLLEACLADGTPQGIGQGIGDILTNLHAHPAPSHEEVGELALHLNTRPDAQPRNRVVITVDGGVVQDIAADRPEDVDVTVLDFDVEGSDHPSVYDVLDAHGHMVRVGLGGATTPERLTANLDRMVRELERLSEARTR